MIKEFVSAFEKKKEWLKEKYSEEFPEQYRDIVELVIRAIRDGLPNSQTKPDPNRVHEINDGEYQGVLVYVIARTGYQPGDYWYVKIFYGSCSGCDTLESIRYGRRKFGEERAIEDLMTLSLHIVQGLKMMSKDGT